MPKTGDTRSRMISSAALLIRESGLKGTSFARVLEHSRAPRGSIAHHFPGGKDEMIGEAIARAGGLAAAAMKSDAENGESAQRIFENAARRYRRILLDTEFRAGCPVGNAAQEGHWNVRVSSAVRDAFDSWRQILAGQLITEGRSEPEAADLAQLCVSSVEGAILLARIDHSPEPIDSVLRTVAPLLETEN